MNEINYKKIIKYRVGLGLASVTRENSVVSLKEQSYDILIKNDQVKTNVTNVTCMDELFTIRSMT